MPPRLASIVCVALFASSGFLAAQPPDAPPAPKETPAKKYHAYAFGCRLGARLVASTDDPTEIARAIKESRRQGLEVQIVSGPHSREDIGVAKPIRYQVFGDGPRRCGTMRLLATTDKEPNYEAISEGGFYRPTFTVVSFR